MEGEHPGLKRKDGLLASVVSRGARQRPRIARRLARERKSLLVEARLLRSGEPLPLLAGRGLHQIRIRCTDPVPERWLTVTLRGDGQ
jgi:hypothetical protein